MWVFGERARALLAESRRALARDGGREEAS
jgi:hypothetical protein